MINEFMNMAEISSCSLHMLTVFVSKGWRAKNIARFLFDTFSKRVIHV